MRLGMVLLLALAFGAARGGAAELAVDPTRIKRGEPCDFSGRSSTTYANPFQDLLVFAVLRGPAGETLRVPGFCAEPGRWTVRVAFPTAGRWQVALESTPADPALKSTREVEVEASHAPGFLRIDSARQRFARESGADFFHAGDTCYPLLGLERTTQRLPYFARRTAQGFSHVRFQAAYANDPRFPELWPWGGTREQPDLDRFNPAFFVRLDQLMLDLRESGLGAEIILLSFYPAGGPMRDPKAWTDAREEAWLRYLVARYAAFDHLVYWTLANEFETRPDGRYRLDEPDDIAWAKARAALVKKLDPFRHPVTVHPYMSAAKYVETFGPEPAIDFLMLQTHGQSETIAPAVIDGSGAGMEQHVAAARAAGKAVVVGEYGYEWDGRTTRGVNATPDLVRRHTWRIAMAGGHFSAGFRGTVFNFAGISFDPENGGRPAGGQIAKLIQFFRIRTKFAALQPRSGIVAAPNLCLAGPGELVIYAPAGGELALELASFPGPLTASWFDPVAERTVEASRVTGGGTVRLAAPWEEAVLHLRAAAPAPSFPGK